MRVSIDAKPVFEIVFDESVSGAKFVGPIFGSIRLIYPFLMRIGP